MNTTTEKDLTMNVSREWRATLDTFSAQAHIDLPKLAAVKAARDALREAAKVRCTCSGFVIQYEGGCCCESGKGKRAAEDRLKQAIDAL